MIVDAETAARGVVTADVCIVGSGPAGLAIALELASTPLRVVLLESGGRKANRRIQALNASAAVRRGYNTIETRRREFGGTINVWGGRWMSFGEVDFVERPWVPDSGWPFDLANLAPFYDRARIRFGTGFDSQSALERERAFSHMLPLDGHGLDARLVERSDAKALVQDAERTLGESDTVVVYLGGTVVGLERSNADRVDGVRVATISGKRFEVRPRHVALAAGGIENARLLLEAGISAASDAGPLVGAFFMDHPYFELGPLVGADRATPVEFTVDGREERQGLRPHGVITLSDQLVRDERLVNSAAHFRIGPQFRHGPAYNSDGMAAARELGRYARRRELPPYLADLARTIGSDASSVVTTLGKSLQGRIRREDAVSVRMLVEASPNRASRIVLGKTRDRLGVRRPIIDWRLQEIDRRGAGRFVDLLSGLLEAEGFGHLPSHPEDGWPGRLLPGNHHTGTTRMHVDSRRGVVDRNARVHGLRNLHVAGSSVFPTSGAANPTLTIVALAIRLADHLQATG